MKVMLEAKDVQKGVELDKEKVQMILKDIDLTIYEGEFVAVMGPSGCGKSTLLYNISGMDQPTKGTVMIDGSSLTAMNEKTLSALRLKQLGFIFQQSNFLKHLSIMDNILLPALQLDNRHRQDLLERTENLLERFGISEIKDKDINQVSGGQLQRAAICRSIINQPKILFGDEPTGSLNSSATKNVMDIIQQIHEEGTTVVLVTHDVRVAARAERVLVMEDGRIMEDISLQDLAADLKEREELLNQRLLARNV